MVRLVTPYLNDDERQQTAHGSVIACERFEHVL
jgi:hypothetical protein